MIDIKALLHGYLFTKTNNPATKQQNTLKFIIINRYVNYEIEVYY